MQHQTVKLPDWVTSADRELDVSDTWMELCDPENEDGAIVTAYLVEDGETEITDNNPYSDPLTATQFEVKGITVTYDGLTKPHDRLWVMEHLGADVVWDWQHQEMQAAVEEEYGVAI